MARLPSLLISLLTILGLQTSGVVSRTFTMENKCDYTVWPGILTNAGVSPLPTTGFALEKGETKTISAPASWGGRFWGRTLCSHDSAGKFSCLTADCGSGKLECSGNGAAPPATVAEFTLDGAGGLDFFDVSLVDGYNLPMLVVPNGGTGTKCTNTGCVTDRRVKDGKGTFQVPPGELLRFSHRVPSYTLTGDEGVGIPSGSVELDPASLPFNIEEVPISRDRKTEASTHSNGFSKSPDTRNEDSNVPKGSSPEGIAIPEAEFYNFDADKSLEKFEIGQIWALYSDEDGLPKYYGQIKNLDCHRSKLHIAWLASNLLPDRVIRWHDEGMPVVALLNPYDSSVKIVLRLLSLSFSSLLIKQINFCQLYDIC